MNHDPSRAEPETGKTPADEHADPGKLLLRCLRRRGLHLTLQRETILEVFLDMDGHPAPEDIHAEIARRGQNVGLATVYRAMRLLTEAGIARRLQFGDGLQRYEPRFGKRRHVHLICEKCGDNFEAASPEIDLGYDALASAHSFTLHTHQTCLYGVCSRCAETLRTGMEPRGLSKKDRGEPL